MVDIQGAKQSFEEADIVKITKYFKKTGATELISYLDKKGNQFDVIVAALGCSRSTVNKRLAEGRELDLITIGQRTRSNDVVKVHQLTLLGEAFSTQMRNIELLEAHRQLRTARAEFKSRERTFKRWLDDNDQVENYLYDSLYALAWLEDTTDTEELPVGIDDIINQWKKSSAYNPE